jgi:hypothetical protein
MRYTRTWTRSDRTGWKIIAAHAMFLTDEPSSTSDDTNGH